MYPALPSKNMHSLPELVKKTLETFPVTIYSDFSYHCDNFFFAVINTVKFRYREVFTTLYQLFMIQTLHSEFVIYIFYTMH